MWVTEFNEEEGVAVWALVDATFEDWDAVVGAIRFITNFPHPNGRRVAVLIFVQDSTPGARQRAAIGEAAGAPGYDPFLAFVTTDIFLRTIMNMLRWFHHPQYEFDMFLNLRAAIHWLESMRGAPIEVLQEMVAKVAERAPFIRDFGVV